MKRRSWLVAGAAAGIAGLVSALWQHRVSAPSAEAHSVWGLRFKQPAGGELVLADFRGKPLLLNFWATWCPPCVTEMPLLDRFAQQQRARDWQVVGLAIDNANAVREFLARQPVGFAIGLAGADGVAVTRMLGNRGGGLPFSVVFDREGKIARTKLGQIHEKDLTEWVSTIR
jgi:thiol-disulfide isomerase/thioredoxin